MFGYLGVLLATLTVRPRASFLRRAVIGAGLLLVGIINPVIQVLGSFDSPALIRALSGLVGGTGLFLVTYPLGRSEEEEL